MRYLKQRDQGTCSPTAFFNAAKHYDRGLQWRHFKILERVCRTNRSIPFGTQFCNSKRCAEHMQERGFVKLVGCHAFNAPATEEENRSALITVLRHVRSGGTAVVANRGVVTMSSDMTRINSMNAACRRIRKEYRLGSSLHMMFIPKAFKETVLCVGTGNSEGLCKVKTDKLNIEQFWLFYGA